MRKNTNRMEKINSEYKRELSQIISYEVKNSKITGMVSVTKVKVTPDLRYAKVYVSIFNSKNVKKTLEGLNDAEGFIRSRVAQEINLRITPELSFVYDDSEEQGERIDRILAELKKEDSKIKNSNNQNS